MTELTFIVVNKNGIRQTATAAQVDANKGSFQILYKIRHLINHESKEVPENELGNYDTRVWSVRPMILQPERTPVAKIHIRDEKGKVVERTYWNGNMGDLRGVRITKSGHLVKGNE